MDDRDRDEDGCGGWMSARFTVDGTVAFIECNCAACGDAAAFTGCALCGWAAEAEESCGLSRMAAPANKRHETAAMVKIDERRKRIPPGNDLGGCYPAQNRGARLRPVIAR